MEVILKDISHFFGSEWIFAQMSFHFNASSSYAITGANGSGKSTLLKILSGALTPSKGSVLFQDGPSTPIPIEQVYKRVTYCAPYIELIEEFNLRELIDYHFKFKKFRNGFDRKKIIEYLFLEQSTEKPIQQFSSGMKQRLKLGLTLFSESELVLLDEPYSNLDVEGKAWAKKLIADHSPGRLLVIASNEPEEYEGVNEVISIMDYKK